MRIDVNETNAQNALATLLLQYAGTTAYNRIVDEARFSKQTVEEVARRTAGNLLNSFVTRKPGGEVVVV